MADARAITDVHVRTWQVAYRGLIPDGFLDRIDRAERLDRWKQITERAEFGGQCLLVAEVAGDLVGFATGGPARDPEPVCNLEVYAIYVDPDSWATGVADALMTSLLHEVGAGEEPVYLWVLSGNTRARAFYARHGFAPDGVVRDEVFDEATVEETRLVRPAQPRQEP